MFARMTQALIMSAVAACGGSVMDDGSGPGIGGTGWDGGTGGEGDAFTCARPPRCNWCNGEERRDSRGCVVGYRCANGVDPCVTGPCTAESCLPPSVCGPDGLCQMPACPPFSCDLDCPKGFLHDEDGCPVCQCRELDCGAPPDCNWCGGSPQVDRHGCVVGYACANGVDPCVTPPCTNPEFPCRPTTVCSQDGLCWPAEPACDGNCAGGSDTCACEYVCVDGRSYSFSCAVAEDGYVDCTCYDGGATAYTCGRSGAEVCNPDNCCGFPFS